MRCASDLRKSISGLKTHYPLVLFGFLLLGIVCWEHISLNPPLVLDLAGSWQARVCAPNVNDCDGWTNIDVPGHFLASSLRSKPWRSVQFRKTFVTPAQCAIQTCKLVFAEVGDTLDLMLNGVEMRVTSSLGSKKPYEKNFALGIDLPPYVLAPNGAVQ